MFNIDHKKNHLKQGTSIIFFKYEYITLKLNILLLFLNKLNTRVNK